MANQTSMRGGGKKLRRSPKHKAKYAAQFARTERNKLNAIRRRERRIARRKAE